MTIAIAIVIALIVLVSIFLIGLSYWILEYDHLWVPIIIIIVLTLVCSIFVSWWFLPLAILLFIMTIWFDKSGTIGKIISGVLALCFVVGALFLIVPTVKTKIANIIYPPITPTTTVSVTAVPSLTTAAPVETAVTPAPTEEPSVCKLAVDLNLRTGGQVEYNLDDGDAVMGTIVLVTKDDPSTQPVLFVIVPGSSLDIEYQGLMFFTSDRYKGTLSEAICLAESLHPEITNKIVIGENGALPEGWQQLDKVDGWWTSSTWLYQEEPIKPEGLTASEGIFVSKVQTNRDLVAKEGQVIYGQFWKTSGSVVHIQVRSGQVLTVPLGYQGTYWIWTGDFKLGENDLQKRMIQATFQEVVDRDEVLQVTLVACGSLPDVDGSLLTFNFRGNDITWNSGLEGWECQVIK